MDGKRVAGSRKLYGGGKLLMYGNLVAGSRKLYGGDLESAVSVMRTVASRIRALPEAFHKKEAYIQVHSHFCKVPVFYKLEVTTIPYLTNLFV
jgi:hypothetical protein